VDFTTTPFELLFATTSAPILRIQSAELEQLAGYEAFMDYVFDSVERNAERSIEQDYFILDPDILDPDDTNNICERCENILEEDGRCFTCDIEPILCVTCKNETLVFEDREGLCEDCYGRANNWLA